MQTPDFFRSRFDVMINLSDPLAVRAKRLPWSLIEAAVAAKFELITGAGGSIGSELCRQVVRFQPARLVLYELSEFNLCTIEQELTEAFPGIAPVRLIGDVEDLRRRGPGADPSHHGRTEAHGRVSCRSLQSRPCKISSPTRK